ncbi:hypothetical protein Tco_1166107 [Tanacetum coccineum]
MEEHRAGMEAYKKVHNEMVRFGLRMAIVQQSMEMDMWEIKEKLAERREQMAFRAYEEDKRREEWIQKIEELKNLIQSFIRNPISPPITTKGLRHCAANRKRKKRKGPLVWTKSKSRVVIEVGQTEAIEGGLNWDNRSANYEQPCQHLLMFDYDPQERELQVKTWDPGITWLKILKEHLEDKSLETTMMSKKMAELEDDFREFKAHTERRFVSLDMSIRAYRLEEDQRHEERIRSYGDFGCLSPNNMTDFEEDEKEFENTRSVAKEDKDEQGKEEKGVVKFFEVGTDEENNSDIVFNDVGGIVYGKGNDTWADAGLKHGSYFLLDRIPEDGWYFHDESRLSKEPLCRSNLEVHLQFHVDRLETGSQVKTWDPGIKFVRSNTLRTRCFWGREY